MRICRSHDLRSLPGMSYHRRNGFRRSQKLPKTEGSRSCPILEGKHRMRFDLQWSTSSPGQLFQVASEGQLCEWRFIYSICGLQDRFFLTKILLHGLDHVLANVVFQIKLFVVISFGTRAVATDRRNVQHSRAKFNECPTLFS